MSLQSRREQSREQVQGVLLWCHCFSLISLAARLLHGDSTAALLSWTSGAGAEPQQQPQQQQPQQQQPQQQPHDGVVLRRSAVPCLE